MKMKEFGPRMGRTSMVPPWVYQCMCHYNSSAKILLIFLLEWIPVPGLGSESVPGIVKNLLELIFENDHLINSTCLSMINYITLKSIFPGDSGLQGDCCCYCVCNFAIHWSFSKMFH